MKPIKKENKRKGLAIALILHLFVVLFLVFTSFDTAKEEIDKEEIVAVMDFSGGGGSEGGAASEEEVTEPTEETEVTESSDSSEEVVTQEEESPVESSSKPASENKENSSAQKETKQEPKFGGLGGVFGKGGNGNSDGTGDGGTGGGTGGGNGPKVGSGDGIGDGTGRLVVSKPNFVNPTQETGRVMVAMQINRDGVVTKATALPTHKETSTSNILLLKEAERLAKKMTFNRVPNGPKVDKVAHIINFKLQ
jgi:outer membrane biosynthesis protein TonB